MVNRRGATAVAGFSGILFVLGAGAWLRTEMSEWWFVVLAPLFLATVVAALALCAVALGRRVRRTGPTVSTASVLLAGAAGLAFATPVGITWDDGCNDHEGRVPAGLAAAVIVAQPETAPAYEASSTLIGCF